MDNKRLLKSLQASSLLDSPPKRGENGAGKYLKTSLKPLKKLPRLHSSP